MKYKLFWILLDEEPIWIENPDEWRDLTSWPAHLWKETIGGVTISTVFTGINHAWDPNMEPVLFETAVIEANRTTHITRYCTFQEAKEGHRVFVDLIQTIQEMKETL